MNWIKEIYCWNYLLSVSLTAWLIAQVLKTIINFILMGKFRVERMWGSGGMPSAHSATVCALVISAGRSQGTHSEIFALAAIMAVIVMYDAMGVRRETGEQAKILNQLLTAWLDEEAKRTPILGDKKLKEMVGHTPFEVFGGAAVGIATCLLIPMM